MAEKIRIPTDLIIEESLTAELCTNETLKRVLEIARELFIPVWHNGKERIDGVNRIPLGTVFGENPMIISRTKRGENELTPEEFISIYGDLDEEHVDFGKIGMLSLNKEVRYFSDLLIPSMLESFYSGSWILGPEVSLFERTVCEKIGVKHAVGVNSGTDALLVGLRALALSRFKKEFFSEDDEIIVPDLTFLATAMAVILSGATPVLANVDERTYTISPESVRKSITKRTKGIVVVHLYGLPCDMKEIMELAEEFGLFVVEDCAQSFWARYDGKFVGTIGDVGCFSFFPSKNLGAHGDGGLVTTSDDDVYHYASILGKYGARTRDYAEHIGTNSRLDSIQASLLLRKLEIIEFLTERRRKIAEIYSRMLEHPHIVPPCEPPRRFHVFHQYTIRVKGGSHGLQRFLAQRGIETRVYYPYPMHKVPSIARKSVAYDNLNTERLVPELLSLPVEPLYPDMLIRYVGKKVLDFFGAHDFL